jgi:hypothetical protein
VDVGDVMPMPVKERREPLAMCADCGCVFPFVRLQNGKILLIQPALIPCVAPIANIVGPNGQPLATDIKKLAMDSLWRLTPAAVPHTHLCPARIESGHGLPLLVPLQGPESGPCRVCGHLHASHFERTETSRRPGKCSAKDCQCVTYGGVVAKVMEQAVVET